MKRTFACILCVILLLALTPAALAAESGSYSDVSADAWYAASVEDATAKGLMNGTGGGEFTPDGTLTRARLSAVLYRLRNPDVR